MYRLILVCMLLCSTFFLNLGNMAEGAVVQVQGFDDISYTSLVEANCRGCHGASISERHHLTLRAVSGNCIYCHQEADGTVIMNNDCLSCHTTSEHHQTEVAELGLCTICHSPAVVSDYGNSIPPKMNKHVPEPSHCRKCHIEDSRTNIGSNIELHHRTGLKECGWCHSEADGIAVNPIVEMKQCQQCHTYPVLHQVHNGYCGDCHGRTPDLPQPNLLPTPPQLEALSDNLGVIGEILTIYGENFGQIPGEVLFGTTKSIVVNWNNSAIDVLIPELYAGNYSVYVVNEAGTSNTKVISVIDESNIPEYEPAGFLNKLYFDYETADCRACHGISVSDRHHLTTNALEGNCTECHVNGTEIQLELECSACHVQSPHHQTSWASVGQCQICHSMQTVVSWGSVPVSTVPASSTLPTTGSCGLCHNDPSNQVLHHQISECNLCHNYNDEQAIRSCEQCHPRDLLHNIDPHREKLACLACHGSDMGNSVPESSLDLPIISSLSSSEGVADNELLIWGEDFGSYSSDSKVLFDNTEAAVIEWQPQRIKVKVPRLKPGTYKVLVSNQEYVSNGKPFSLKTDSTNIGQSKTGKHKHRNGWRTNKL